jgi:glycolate oxidase
VINADLQTALEPYGLFYPPDPSSYRQSAIGGNVAENAGGARCLKYGVTGDYVLALEVVLPDGRIIRTGGRSVKNVTGYNLRALFTGAEGTLGTITEITLKLIRRPRVEMTALAAFDELAQAAGAVNAVLATGVLPAAIELLDRLTIECVESYTPAGLPRNADAVILVALDGNHEAALRADLATVEAVLREHRATSVVAAESAEERERLWSARRAVSPALARKRPNKLGEDVAVPRSALTAMVTRVREIAAKYELLIPVFGHAGDGNIHPNILCDRRDADEMARVRLAAREIFEAAVELGGTLSGEHGIGLLKRQFLELDLGRDVLDVMRAVKASLDPHDIMNPGKLFPAPGGFDAFLPFKGGTGSGSL